MAIRTNGYHIQQGRETLKRTGDTRPLRDQISAVERKLEQTKRQLARLITVKPHNVVTTVKFDGDAKEGDGRSYKQRMLNLKWKAGLEAAKRRGVTLPVASETDNGLDLATVELKILRKQEVIADLEFRLFALKAKVSNPSFNRNVAPRKRNQTDKGHKVNNPS